MNFLEVNTFLKEVGVLKKKHQIQQFDFDFIFHIAERGTLFTVKPESGASGYLGRPVA